MATSGSTKAAPPFRQRVKIDYPPLFEAAENASKTGHFTYAGLIRADVALLLVGGIAGSLSTVGPTSWQQLTAVVASVAIAIGILLRWLNRSQHPERRWFDGRAAAESVKTESWLYMMRIEPFDDDSSAKEKFLSSLHRIRTLYSKRHLTLGTSSTESQIPVSMEDVRRQPLPERQAIYRDKRVNDQVKWYKDKAAAHTRDGRIFVGMGVGAEAVALAWLLSRFAFGWNLNLVAVFTSFAVAATALSQLNSHEELVQRYRDAQQNLQEIEAQLPASHQTPFAEIVKQVESAISAENGAWHAKRA